MQWGCHMVDDPTLETTEEILSELFRRCEIAKFVGGIALRDVVSGAVVPDGWSLDELTQYFVPSLEQLDALSGTIH